MENNESSARKDMIESIMTRLGGDTIDVELDYHQIDKCIDLGLRKLKQMGDAFIEESMVLLTLKKDQKEYILPNEIVEVMQIYRKGYGRAFGSDGGQNMDPFSFHWYTLMAGGNINDGRLGNVVSFELYHDYLKTMGKQMGMYLNFTYNENTHKLVIAENPRADNEVILLHSFVDRPIAELLKDRYAGLWIENWAYMECLQILAKIRGRFKGLPGPIGSISSDDSELKAEAKELREQLEKELKAMVPMGNSIVYNMPFLG